MNIWQPVLEGSLLILRPLLESDFEALFAAANDPRTWEQHPQTDRYKEEVFRKYFEGALDSKGALVVIEKDTNRVIGCSRFYKVGENSEQLAIGFTFLSFEYWGGRYNREMKNLMLSYAFAHVDKIIFEVGEKNLRSQKAVEKLGAKEIDRVMAYNSLHVIYALTAQEFSQLS